ncbi:MAG TPA: hypothetical protein VFU82_02090 [Gammaproteobacteria bacterium]|nr:hypothetical protein [Gammaproteobacteria bacterium]
MLKRQALTLSLIFSFFISTNMFAATPLSCDQLINTHWADTNDSIFGRITLGFEDEGEHDLIYNLSYFSDRFGDGGYVNRCDAQSDGSLLLTIPLSDDFGYLLLKTTDLQTFTVLPPSRLVNQYEKQIAIRGPFSRA